MIRHIVAVRYRDGFSPEENEANAKRVKELLEALKQVIPGIIEFTVHINLCSSSNMDVVFDSIFENEKALNAYHVHPAHVRVANYVRTVMKDRICVDFPVFQVNNQQVTTNLL